MESEDTKILSSPESPPKSVEPPQESKDSVLTSESAEKSKEIMSTSVPPQESKEALSTFEPPQVSKEVTSTYEPLQESKESRKKQEKDRKKGEKKMDQFIKSIANCTPEEKVDALCKKNSESLDQIRTLKTSIQLLQRKITIIEKEKEQLQNDQSKGVLARSRLETLCRELQRQNKSIKDESMQKIREEEEKRKEVATRFQTALNEVSVMMQQNTDKNLKLRDDNIEISNKFQTLCDQFKQREEEVTRLTKQMDLEKQLAETTVKRMECQLNAERGMWSKEKEHYAAQLKFHEEEKVKFECNIKNLEDHLSLYSNKYTDFESTIARSNEVFDTYKVELNRLSRQIKKLEHDNGTWKDKWLQTHQALNSVTLEHRSCDKSLQERDKKLKQLADLCRSIQEERSAYLKQLKENGVTPAVVVIEKPPTEPEKPEKPKNSVSHKVTKKEKHLSLLKKEMQVIEKQLSDTLKSSRNESKGKNESKMSEYSTPLEEPQDDNINQSQSNENIDINQEAAKTIESEPVDNANITESKDSCEIHESNSAPVAVNCSDNKSDTEISVPVTEAKEENVEFQKPICVKTESELNSPAQSVVDVNQAEEKETSPSINNTDTNKIKNKSKNQKSKKNKK